MHCLHAMTLQTANMFTNAMQSVQDDVKSYDRRHLHTFALRWSQEKHLQICCRTYSVWLCHILFVTYNVDKYYDHLITLIYRSRSRYLQLASKFDSNAYLNQNKRLEWNQTMTIHLFKADSIVRFSSTMSAGF